MMDTTNTTSSARGVMTYVMGAIAVLTCPCHLPILLLLLSGTTAGAFLSQNLGIAFLLLLPVFLLIVGGNPASGGSRSAGTQLAERACAHADGGAQE